MSAARHRLPNQLTGNSFDTYRHASCSPYFPVSTGSDSAPTDHGSRREGTPLNEILLVEDNPDDVELTLRAFRMSKIANEIIVAHDGLEALDYLFATGEHAGRVSGTLPQLVLLDLKLPRIDG